MTAIEALLEELPPTTAIEALLEAEADPLNEWFPFEPMDAFLEVGSKRSSPIETLDPRLDPGLELPGSKLSMPSVSCINRSSSWHKARSSLLSGTSI